jgi:hypothetical protein
MFAASLRRAADKDLQADDIRAAHVHEKDEHIYCVATPSRVSHRVDAAESRLLAVHLPLMTQQRRAVMTQQRRSPLPQEGADLEVTHVIRRDRGRVRWE